MNKKKILALTRYTNKGASSRLRIGQYIPYLKQHGISVKLSPFFSDYYLDNLYLGKKNYLGVFFLYVRRFGVLMTVRKYDIIWIEKEVFPYFPSFVESLITLFGVQYVVDYDDAIFHNYEALTNRFLKLMLANKFDTLLKKSELIVTCNQYLMDYMYRHGAKNVVQIPTVVNTDRYDMEKIPYHDEFRIGWIGSPSTTKYLDLIKEPLGFIASKYSIKLVVIGGIPLSDYNLPIETHNWSEQSEAELLSTLDIGIMPLFDTSWEKGKCGYKIIQYMASGLPVIASSVGFNKEIVTGEFGFLVGNKEEWAACIESFIKNTRLLHEYGERARLIAKRDFSLAKSAPALLNHFRSII